MQAVADCDYRCNTRWLCKRCSATGKKPHLRMPQPVSATKTAARPYYYRCRPPPLLLPSHVASVVEFEIGSR